MAPSLSIVIPAYNEELRLPETLEKITAYLKNSRWQAEILVVDDGSRDGTVRVTEEWQRQHSCVKLVRNPGNRGKGYAVKNGMLEAKGDWRLFTDADLSTPIEELEKLWAAVEQGAQVAIGSRALDRSLVGVHQSAFREFAGRVFNLLMRTVLRLPLCDTQCGFKLYSGPAAELIFQRQRLERFGFDAEALFIARKLGFPIREVAVRWNNAEGTKVSLWNGAQPFLDLFRIRLNHVRGRYQ